MIEKDSISENTRLFEGVELLIQTMQEIPFQLIKKMINTLLY